MKLIIVILILLVVLILTLRKKQPKLSLDDGNLVKFTRHPNEDITPLVGEEVKLWRKPNTDQVNIYVKGTIGGEGLIGFVENEQIANHLSAGGLYKAVISRFDYNSCTSVWY